MRRRHLRNCELRVTRQLESSRYCLKGVCMLKVLGLCTARALEPRYTISAHCQKGVMFPQCRCHFSIPQIRRSSTGCTAYLVMMLLEVCALAGALLHSAVHWTCRCMSPARKGVRHQERHLLCLEQSTALLTRLHRRLVGQHECCRTCHAAIMPRAIRSVN
jgi:hypothetical protein